MFIRPPGISEGAFQLRMGNIWFGKLLLLFKIRSKTDDGMRDLDCAYVSVLEEYTGPRRKGYILHMMHITHISYLFDLFTFSFPSQHGSMIATICQSTIVYERREQAQVLLLLLLYVIPVSSILGRHSLVPVGETGTIPFDMGRESADFPGAACDKSHNSGDGCRWWYVNSWALTWRNKR